MCKQICWSVCSDGLTPMGCSAPPDCSLPLLKKTGGENTMGKTTNKQKTKKHLLILKSQGTVNKEDKKNEDVTRKEPPHHNLYTH